MPCVKDGWIDGTVALLVQVRRKKQPNSHTNVTIDLIEHVLSPLSFYASPYWRYFFVAGIIRASVAKGFKLGPQAAKNEKH